MLQPSCSEESLKLLRQRSRSELGSDIPDGYADRPGVGFPLRTSFDRDGREIDIEPALSPEPQVAQLGRPAEIGPSVPIVVAGEPQPLPPGATRAEEMDEGVPIYRVRLGRPFPD